MDFFLFLDFDAGYVITFFCRQMDHHIYSTIAFSSAIFHSLRGHLCVVNFCKFNLRLAWPASHMDNLPCPINLRSGHDRQEVNTELKTCHLKVIRNKSGAELLLM